MSMAEVHRGDFHHCISLLDLFQMSPPCNKRCFLAPSVRLFSPAKCGRRSVLGPALDFHSASPVLGPFALQIPSSLFSFFCAQHASSIRRCLSPLRVTSPLKLPSICSQLPSLCVRVAIRHGRRGTVEGSETAWPMN